MSKYSHPSHDTTLSPCSVRTEPAEFRSRRVHVDLRGDRAVLHGTVGSFYEKQLAQEMARKIDGVKIVENELQVEYPAEEAVVSS